jgi:hypothetical protein
MPQRSVPIVDRFWAKVRKADGDACWEWTGATKPQGYGVMGVGKRGTGVIRVTRFSYELHFGPFDKELFVLHKCDNPRCVRPDHLFLGTARDNIRDAMAKGRWKPPRGRRKLSDDQVREIRREFRPGMAKSMAQNYGVTERTIHNVVSGDTWNAIR